MSYAEIAESSGPTGGTKIPEVPRVERHDNPHGKVDIVSQETADKLRADVDDAVEKGSKKLSKAEKEGKEKLDTYGAYLKTQFDQISTSVSNYASSFFAKSKTEVQNPVVVSQIVVCLGALSAAYVGYVERYRVFGSPHPKSAVTAHAAIITGLVFLDGFLFNKYYPKYDKKTKKY